MSESAQSVLQRQNIQSVIDAYMGDQLVIEAVERVSPPPQGASHDDDMHKKRILFAFVICHSVYRLLDSPLRFLHNPAPPSVLEADAHSGGRTRHEIILEENPNLRPPDI